ncbi:MAG TPA: hypothetical protein VI485_27730 [Vicinamibacterales bacterium]|nr:hypothetical protein [Vicinamibacterales bacterium]
MNHRRAHVGMAEEFLHGADVIPAFEQVCGERVPFKNWRGMPI